jgi:hypothetical protein
MVSERLSVPLGVDRRGRGISRERDCYAHRALVLVWRFVWETENRPWPVWDPAAHGCRTVERPRANGTVGRTGRGIGLTRNEG